MHGHRLESTAKSASTSNESSATPGFIELSFTDDEVRVAIAGAPDRDESITRLWVAKEVAAKATGSGLHGSRSATA